MSKLQTILTPLTTEEAAIRLLGAEIIRTYDDGSRAVVRIVEVEAYDQNDPASHTFIGPTMRNEAMFGPAGRAYVYRIYGIHWCFNVTAGREGFGEGVLIRAAEPVTGVEALQRHRPGVVGLNLTNGPAKLAQALSIDGSLKQHNLQHEPLQVQLRRPVAQNEIIRTTRIGITKAPEMLRRYYLKDFPYISRA